MLLYLAICYGAALGIGPLGRDYAALADPASLSWPVSAVVSWERHAFGTVCAGYHLANATLLYGCMVLVYLIAQRMVKGPAWLGTLAATLFMACPVYSESVLNLTGIRDLLPCLAALAAVAVYVEHAVRPRVWYGVLWLLLAAAAVWAFSENVWLILFAPLYESCFAQRGGRSWRRVALATAVTMLAAVPHFLACMPQDMSLPGMFAPLYFLFYPIGYLPETALRFHQTPWIAWMAALAVLALAGLLLRKARHPAVTFGLLMMAATQLLQGARFVDPVHMVGGGRLLAAGAFYNVAFAGLCLRILRHPKWPRTVILGTTFLCVVFFALQIQSVWAWRKADQIAAEFRHAAQGPCTLLPDYRYSGGAPLCLSEAIRYETPFGPAFPCWAPLQIDRPPGNGLDLHLKAIDETTYELEIHGTALAGAIPWPYTLAGVGSVVDKEETRVECVSRSREAMLFRVESKAGPFPPLAGVPVFP